MTNAISVRNLRKRFSAGKRGGHFTALDGLSFDVPEGQVMGVIGRNGAGKSTLLKILARIIPPTSGRVELRGRVGSLLEVGTGFHPDLSGRENIYLSAALLGMQESEIRKRFDAIVDFSGVEAFIDTEVKRYSSGMYMRLAFSVAAHLEPKILLVDEVLAVGDVEFQKKCVQRLNNLGKNGQTVLFVSHNMAAVARLCSHGIWIDGGKLAREGPIAEISTAYLKQGAVHPGTREWPDYSSAPGDEVARLRRVMIRGPEGQPTASVNIGQEFTIEVDYDVAVDGMVLYPAIQFINEWDAEVLWSTDTGTPLHGKPRPAGRYRCAVRIPANLLSEGLFTASVTIASLRPRKVHVSEPDAVHFQAMEVIDGTTARGEYTGHVGSVIRPRLDWTVNLERTKEACPI
jgi:lipopolysaccharide transport system ATP-binding protein